MNRTQHPSNNAVLGAPAGWDQEELPCGALPITRTKVDGIDCVVSYWRPTAAELAELNAGSLVMLHVIGMTMPLMAVGVSS